MIKAVFLSILVCLACFACNPNPPKGKIVNNNPAASTTEVYDYVIKFNEYIETTTLDSSYPGAAIVIVKDSSIIYIKGLGVKKIGTTDSVNLHTVFRLASVSKGFASVLASVFVQKGLIHWDDKVTKYLPDFKLKNKESTEALTIRHILNQTTGLPTHTFTNMIESGIPYPTLRDKLKEIPLSNLPGKDHSYQNVAYSIIADILEKVSGKNYETLLNEYIFGPLKMNDASANLSDLENSDNHASPHLTLRDGFKPIKNTSEYYTVLPAAGVNASILDMGEYLLALLGNDPEVVNPDRLKEIFAPEVVTPRRRKYFFMRWLPVKKTYYGLGWRVLEYNKDTMVYHGGGVRGYRAEIALIPSHKIGIAILCNAPGKFINSAIPTFFDLFYKYDHP